MKRFVKIMLLSLQCLWKKEHIDNLEIKVANNSKHNVEMKRQAILLIITDDESLHYLVVATFSILFNGISEKLDKHETFCKDYAC